MGPAHSGRTADRPSGVLRPSRVCVSARGAIQAIWLQSVRTRSPTGAARRWDRGPRLQDFNSAFGGVSTRVAQNAGIVAALGWAFFVPAQTYAVILMPTALVAF